MSYIYHYRATYQDLATYPEVGYTYSVDGILTTDYKIDTMERYREIKKVIDPKRNDLAITSLSFLHTCDVPTVNDASPDSHNGQASTKTSGKE